MTGNKARFRDRLIIAGAAVLAAAIVLVVIFIRTKDPTSAESMDDGSPITIYNPRFRRNKHGRMLMLVDYRFNRGSADDSMIYIVQYRGDGTDRWRDLVPGRRLKQEGTIRIGQFKPQENRTLSVDISLHSQFEDERLSNYLPVTIPQTDAELQQDRRE